MKVLQINSASGIKSTGRNCFDLANYLMKKGHKAYIAYSYGVPFEYSYKIGSPFDRKLHGLLSRVYGKQAYFSKRSTKELLKYIEVINPDVVHLHNLHANYINLELLLGYLANKNLPTLLNVHDCWLYTGKCTHYTAEGCFKWQSGCGNCPRLKKDNISWFFDQTSSMYKDKKKWIGKIQRLAVIGVSDWITQEISKSFLSSANIVKRIYNWVDTDAFKPVPVDSIKQKLGIQKNKFIILGVASKWTTSKGLDQFLELAKFISEDMIILLVGNIDNNISLPDNLIHIGQITNTNELVHYYSVADVFLNLSLEESFGKVTSEALSCGTPSIVINSTANPELIGYRCGFILKKNRINDILQCLNHIKTVGKSYFSNYCIDFVVNNFNKEKLLNEYLKVYSDLSKR